MATGSAVGWKVLCPEAIGAKVGALDGLRVGVLEGFCHDATGANVGVIDGLFVGVLDGVLLALTDATPHIGAGANCHNKQILV
jgi:hypothetical protein